MTTRPMKTWEEIVAEAEAMTAGGSDAIDKVDAYLFAAAVIYFDAAIKDGGTKLPASWKPAAAHAAGYEHAAQ